MSFVASFTLYSLLFHFTLVYFLHFRSNRGVYYAIVEYVVIRRKNFGVLMDFYDNWLIGKLNQK